MFSVFKSSYTFCAYGSPHNCREQEGQAEEFPFASFCLCLTARVGPITSCDLKRRRCGWSSSRARCSIRQARTELALAPGKDVATYIHIYESVVKSESRQFTWWQACWESRPEAAARNGCIFTVQLSTLNFSTYTLLTFLQRGLSAEGELGKCNPGIGQ